MAMNVCGSWYNKSLEANDYIKVGATFQTYEFGGKVVAA